MCGTAGAFASCVASGSGPAIETGAWPRRPQAARAQPRNRIVTVPLTWRTHQAPPARVMKTRTVQGVHPLTDVVSPHFIEARACRATSSRAA